MSDTCIAFQATLRPERRDELLAQRARRAAAETDAQAGAERDEAARLCAESGAQIHEFADQLTAQLREHQQALPPGPVREAIVAVRRGIAALLREADEATEVASLCALEGRLFQLGQDGAAALGAPPDPGAPTAAWEAERTDALCAQAALLIRLAGLRALEPAATFCAPRLHAAAQIVDRIGDHLRDERWAEAAAIARSAQGLCDVIQSEAAARQLVEEQRASLVSGLLDALRQQELVVPDPELAQSGDLDSDVVLHVHRVVRPLTVRVSKAGRLSYHSPGTDPTLWLVAHKAQHVLADSYGFDLAPCE